MDAMKNPVRNFVLPNSKKGISNRAKRDGVYILDSFALLTYLQDEKGADRIAKLLERAKKQQVKIYMHAINLGEVYYIIFHKKGEFQADSIYGNIKRYPVEFIEHISEEFLLNAARLKARFFLSFVNSFAVATAQALEGMLITGDPGMKVVEEEGIVRILWI